VGRWYGSCSVVLMTQEERVVLMTQEERVTR